ncbi:7128_t:CDS:1, partial [Racocetra fulgida]
DKEDVFIVRRLNEIEVEESDVNKMLEGAINKDVIEIKEILSINDQDLMDIEYEG